MAKEAILKIRETEAKAEEMIADARKQAQAMQEEAKANGQALLDRAELESAKAEREKLAATKKQNETLVEKGKADALLEVEGLKREASLKKKIAEKIVLRGLEEKCR